EAEAVAAASAARAAHREASASAWRLLGSSPVRHLFVLALLAAAWEAGARYGDNSILFPTFLETLDALRTAFADEGLGRAAAASLVVL
ncbi:hypothetical protein ABTM13_19780, partial [Acinetobacter baumannii]